MRKFFGGHSLVGVAIIISVFILAVFLRFYDLGTQGPWTDEIASWWYLRHIDTVFYRESHSPLFYGILRIFLGKDATLSGIRHFVAAISVIHLIELFFLGQLALKKRAFLIFWVFICLNPADIVHARMARHYSWLLEGVLVYFLLWKINAPRWMKMLSGIFAAFIHVFAVIPIAALAFYDFYLNRRRKELAISLIPCFLPLAYYAVRFITFGNSKVLSNISWVKSTSYIFLTSTITQLFGDSFPRFEFYPVEPILAGVIFAATLVPIFYYRKQSGRIFFIVFISSIILVEILSPWANFRVNRFVIYLSGFWLFAIADSLEDAKDYIFFPVIICPFLYLMYFNPLYNFPWERERVEQWERVSENETDAQKLICMNIYQSEYFGKDYENCVDKVLLIDTKKPVLFFDLNGTETYAVGGFVKTMNVTEYLPLDYGGLIVRFDPKVIIPPPETKKKPKGKNGKSKK